MPEFLFAALHKLFNLISFLRFFFSGAAFSFYQRGSCWQNAEGKKPEIKRTGHKKMVYLKNEGEREREIAREGRHANKSAT